MKINGISLSEPYLFGNEKKYINECIDSNWVSTAGYFVEKFEQEIAKFCNVKYAVSCNSGSSALDIALKLAGVEKNDEVIVPTLTFIASVNAIAYNQAHPLFIDVDEYFNLDVTKYINFIKNNTFKKDGYTFNLKTKRRIKAIMPVHVWGNAVNFSSLLNFCKDQNIEIVEDATESLGSRYTSYEMKKKKPGGLGLVGCLSFNGNKIITSGGGGMILTNNKDLAKKALYLTTQAKDDSLRFIHNNVGYNYRLPNINAALGLAQLENINEILKLKKQNHDLYRDLFRNHKKLNICDTPSYAENNHWMNILRIESNKKNIFEPLLKHLIKLGIQVRPIWYLNHKQRQYVDCSRDDLSYAEGLYSNSLCLPSSTGIKKSQIEIVAKEIKAFID